MSDVFVEEKFEAKVSFSDDPRACWEWTGATGTFGVAVFYSARRGKTVKAGHLAFEWAKCRPIRRKLFLRHTCDNPACVNPTHLVEGTHEDNMWDVRMRRRGASLANGRHRSLLYPESSTKGERNPSAKLKIEDVREIRRLRTEGWKLVPLGAKFDVSATTISYICRGKNWKEETITDG